MELFNACDPAVKARQQAEHGAVQPAAAAAGPGQRRRGSSVFLGGGINTRVGIFLYDETFERNGHPTS
jgi:hypothetical protein